MPKIKDSQIQKKRRGNSLITKIKNALYESHNSYVKTDYSLKSTSTLSP